MFEYLVVFLPLISFFSCSLLIKFRESICLQLWSSLLVGVAAILSWKLFYSLGDGETLSLPVYTWISVGFLESNFSLHVDRFISLMFAVVNTVSFVVHCYSIGYMKSDPHKSRFFAYLSLFTFAMLVLVSAGDFLQLFLGWEGVGVCSYLLIGFWFKKESANLASMKAFIVNRIGDFCFLVGIFAVYKIFGTLDFTDVTSSIELHLDTKILGFDAISFICLMLFIGCMSKSAQLGLHTWLPDAMEGPTPVSALIHAATMVTAGVFLVAKLSLLFESAPLVRQLIMWIGIATAIFGGVIALYQDDIKKTIAYSTCSQLGYMFAACGASAYVAAVFHLATHAFFKALLFLCAGNVIHSVHGEQNMHKMGGLRRRMPSTYYMMLIGSLALCGIFPFAGFYSKDLIILSLSFSEVPFILSILAVLCTSLYSCKLLILVFSGKERFDVKKFHSPSISMTLPLSLLVFFSVTSGYFGAPFLLEGNFWANTGLVFKAPIEVHGFKHFLPITFALAGLILSYSFRDVLLQVGYLSRNRWFSLFGLLLFLLLFLSIDLAIVAGVLLIGVLVVDRKSFIFSNLCKLLRSKFYFDEIYHFLFVKRIAWLSNFFWRDIDIACIDSIPGLCAKIVDKTSSVTLSWQTGLIYHHALFFILGLLLFLWVI
ncbi:proton-translocating NADH-quinone oxidoreductase, chain L family protein [Neorickettsia helminthoeca str. Oregon]|uniref:NADH-quinone oxidoreductase subunit L n=1 Tax=Neorickettsia helminthoeca str. Oregon TaxID=1286528 RepID=X5H2X3_9RICK|nr:NADH-quinone oxidoreductase subunit L [Neorickettsia helminthoeca]AHX10993.1 proton-translocating NADH-quinone oxidoreductase, chain L family protein [Neorickettsia helminthoeca str. Oregon]